VGFGGGEALVPEVDGDAEFGAEVFGEGLGFGGLGALVAGHVEGVADDGFRCGVLAEDAGDGFEIGAAVGAVQGEEGLRGKAEGVGDGDADAAVADVEADDAAYLGARLLCIHLPSVCAAGLKKDEIQWSLHSAALRSRLMASEAVEKTVSGGVLGT
jgi:hypothetical protein